MPAETTIEIITRHREDLFALSRILFTAIDTPILTDAENPVTVSVRGTYGGGKKIIPDAAREALLGDKKQCLFDGKEEYDEIWRGTANGVPFEIAFINTDIKKGYDCIPGSENMREVAEQFMALRQSGGITFVHNNDGFGNHRAGIDIWMEKQGAPLVGIQGSLAKLSALSQTFNNVSNSDDATPWTRYVRIRVRDERLLSSAKFNEALTKIKTLHLRDTPESITPVAPNQIPIPFPPG